MTDEDPPRAAPSAAPPPGWEDILVPGEEIVWQGRPDTAVTLMPIRPAQIGMGVFMTCFALFWITQAISITWSSHHAPWFFRWIFPAFGLIFVVAGLHMAGGYAYSAAFKRRHTWYTLTNRNAYVATDLPWQGKRLKSYPISRNTTLEFDGADPGTIHFAHETRRGNNRSYQVAVGFERIGEAATVHRLMREIQQGQTS